jgi:hypothetical protein
MIPTRRLVSLPLATALAAASLQILACSVSADPPGSGQDCVVGTDAGTSTATDAGTSTGTGGGTSTATPDAGVSSDPPCPSATPPVPQYP